MLTARHIGVAVSRASRLPLSGRDSCLAQAIAAQAMLRRRGIASTVYLGLAREARYGLGAHAWVRSGGMILTGRAGHRRFHVVATFATGS